MPSLSANSALLPVILVSYSLAPMPPQLCYHNDHRYPQCPRQIPTSHGPTSFQAPQIYATTFPHCKEPWFPHPPTILPPTSTNCNSCMHTFHTSTRENTALPFLSIHKSAHSHIKLHCNNYLWTEVHHEIYTNHPQCLHLLPSLLFPQTLYPLVSFATAYHQIDWSLGSSHVVSNKNWGPQLHSRWICPYPCTIILNSLQQDTSS